MTKESRADKCDHPKAGGHFYVLKRDIILGILS